jgi:hypothetical protein
VKFSELVKVLVETILGCVNYCKMMYVIGWCRIQSSDTDDPLYISSRVDWINKEASIDQCHYFEQ